VGEEMETKGEREMRGRGRENGRKEMRGRAADE